VTSTGRAFVAHLHPRSAQEAPIPHPSRTIRAAIAVSLLALGACFGDRDSGSGELSQAERAAYTAPADSSLTAAQVDRYLRTTLAQVELLRAEGPQVRARLATVQRASAPPAGAKGPRPKTRQALWSDFVDGAFVRSARKLGYRPAELLYVRERLSSVSGKLLATEMSGAKDQTAALFRQQAESMRGTPGVTQAQIDAMLQAAAQAEQQTPRPVHPRTAQNLAALRQAHPPLNDATWGKIAGVAAGIGMGELGELPDADAGRRLDELRQLHRDALENRNPSR
jgi:hypothetical protein